MSYCVNCGVELDASARKCALCATPVINPNIKNPETEETPFSEKLQIPEGIKKRFIAFVITVIMLIPDIVMFFMNVFFIKNGFWSIYVIAASLLVWVLFVLPLLAGKKHPFMLWAFDTVAVAGFCFVTIGLNCKEIWILKSVLCVIALVSLCVLIVMLWMHHRKRHWTSITVVLLLDAAAVSLLSGVLTTHFSGNFNFFIVGIVIAVCALVMMLFFIYCNRSKHIRAWLNKVFYI